MKDNELRGLILQAFYQKRRSGWLGLGVNTGEPLEFDDRVPPGDVVHIADQLSDAGLIEWKPVKNHRGHITAGVGKINAFGVDVIEGTMAAPVPIVFDQSSHVQHINISGQHGGVQVAGAHSNQQQTIVQEIEKLVSAINGSSVPEEEKKKAKSRLASFLESAATAAVLGPLATKLLELCK